MFSKATSRLLTSRFDANLLHGRTRINQIVTKLSNFSSTAASAPNPSANQNNIANNEYAPQFVTFEMAKSVVNMSHLYVDHGLSAKQLENIAKKEDMDTVGKWQSMMEAFLAAQVHTLAGFGYSPNEAGLQLYNSQVAQLMQSGTVDGSQQEEIRVSGRDLWRSALSKAFDVSLEDINSKAATLDVPKARDMMHMVSSRMQDPKILEMIAQQTSSAAADATAGTELNAKHTAVQRILVNEVYLGGDPSVVEQCGFEAGEKGYVLMQCVMAEHQTDPLIAQYIGGAMMRILQSAGLDPASLQK